MHPNHEPVTRPTPVSGVAGLSIDSTVDMVQLFLHTSIGLDKQLWTPGGFSPCIVTSIQSIQVALVCRRLRWIGFVPIRPNHFVAAPFVISCWAASEVKKKKRFDLVLFWWFGLSDPISPLAIDRFPGWFVARDCTMAPFLQRIFGMYT
jgi:hypothetical protein